MSEARISIAMATYNGSAHLRAQLNSIAAQSLLPAELVACDDRSSDDTLDILRDFAAEVPFPVRVHRNAERLGYQLNFRRAVSLCEAPLIAFCDQDDVWYPRKLERQSRAFEDPSVQLAYHNAEVVGPDGTVTGHMHDREREERELAADPPAPYRFCYGLLQMFRASLRQYDRFWDRCRGPHDFSKIIGHDQWFYFLAAALGRVAYVDEVLLQYRQHGENQYGAPVRLGLLNLIKRSLNRYGMFDEEMASESLTRARVLREIADGTSAPDSHLSIMAAEFEKLSARYARRFRTYSRSTALGRGGSLLSALGAGDYSRGDWAFNRLDIVRDLWSGVLWNRVTPPMSAKV